jgi:hypothetical protein
MKILFTIFCLLLLNLTASAQKQVVPIVEMKLSGLIGGVQNGKWLTSKQTAPKLKKSNEFFLVGWNGIEEGGITVGERGEIEDVCDDFYRMKFDLTMDSGVAIGEHAKWNPMPRVPKTIDPADYKKIVAGVLKIKGITKTTVKIEQAYRVDLEGDGKDEVILVATFYKNGLASNATIGDYSFVLLRKIVGKTVQNIVVAGDFIKRNIDFGAPNQYMLSSIADLNSDGKMEIVIYGEYYERSWAAIYEIKGNKPTKVLEADCGV